MSYRLPSWASRSHDTINSREPDANSKFATGLFVLEIGAAIDDRDHSDTLLDTVSASWSRVCPAIDRGADQQRWISVPLCAASHAATDDLSPDRDWL
jgi:hypothetical protein